MGENTFEQDIDKDMDEHRRPNDFDVKQWIYQRPLEEIYHVLKKHFEPPEEKPKVYELGSGDPVVSIHHGTDTPL